MGVGCLEELAKEQRPMLWLGQEEYKWKFLKQLVACLLHSLVGQR